MNSPVALLDRLNAALSGRYRVERTIGQGGMATVCLAEDTRHSRRVALKVLRPEVASALGADRFLREIETIAGLTHPHILPLHDSGEADGLLYYVMPYVAGESLQAKLSKEGALPIEEALGIAVECADALDHAHRRDVIHRDVKPGNVLLADGHAMLADFGIARAVAQATDAAALTRTGVALGTVGYMSPEQATGEEKVDARSDLYGLGCVLYEMLAGEAPFRGHSAQIVLARQLTGDPPSVSAIRTSVTADLEGIVRRALAANPADRFQTAAEFRDAIRQRPAAWSARDTAHGAASGSPDVAQRRPAQTAREGRETILVLPFANISPDPENEYFSDGLTDEIITDLSRIRSLGVISRTSAMRLKGSDKDVLTIGREMGVRYVLEGSVRKSGNDLRITAQLIDAASDEHLWAEKYVGTIADVFEIQEQVASAIAGALRIRLTAGERRELGSRPIEDVRAYESYLRARHGIWRFSADGLEDALRHTRNALDIVGDNELLLATLGQIHVWFIGAGLSADPAHFERADACVDGILAIDPGSRHLHRLRGIVAFHKGDFRRARPDLERALEAAPDDPEALAMLGYLYALSGREEAALDLFARALAVDPLTPINHAMPGFVAMMRGRPDEFLPCYRTFVELDGRGPFSLMCWVYALCSAGRVQDGIEAAEELARRYGDTVFASGALSMSRGVSGDRAGALEAITPAFREVGSKTEMFARFLAECYALAGALDAAIDSLETAVRLGCINHPFLSRIDPLLANLRDHPRFLHLMDLVERDWRAFDGVAAQVSPPDSPSS